MREYKTYVFDLDGTLLNTINDLAASVNFALKEYGMSQHTVDEVRNFVGNGVKKLMERAVPDGLDTTKPYPGIVDLLRELKKRGKNIAVVSNKFYDATGELVRHFFGEYVKVAIGERENIRKKPAPDTVLEAFRLLGVDKEEAVYIGDSDVDVNTAKNVGIPCISVLWGFRDKEFLIENGATTFVETPQEIL